MLRMKRILGLDLGSSSIGWAIVEESDEVIAETGSSEPERESSAAERKGRIVAVGSRIVPLTTEESTQFAKGQALTKNADRTRFRTQRKGYDRYRRRRALLLEELDRMGMYDGKTLPLPTLDLWGLRARAVSERLTLRELGRVLCHINQKRGYRTVKSDFGDKKLGAYVQQVVGRYRELHEQGRTVGQFMYEGLRADPSFRCKERVYPRDAYVEEFDAIMACQRGFYPDLLTERAVDRLRNHIIFHQRPLKSCKHLVAHCELERYDRETGGRVRNCGPRVAPRSSPLFQACKLWESINNLTIRNKEDDVLHITLEQKRAFFEFMTTHEKLKIADLKALLGIRSREWQLGQAIGRGLQGNTTYCEIARALGNHPDRESLLRFDLRVTDDLRADPETGEVRRVVDSSFEREPLYRLWHALYSIEDMEELRRVLRGLGITDKDALEALCRIDFVKSGYGNKSARAMRRILPYLQEGMQYYEAKCAAGYDDAPLDRARNEARELAERLAPIPKGELRQPVVEKILTQMANLVNALMEEHRRFDEIRVELARELKQSREERESADKAMARNNKENDRVAKLIAEYGLTPTRSRIRKYRLWEESERVCIYCGQPVDVKEFLLGFGVEVEHIIPRSVLFDDSFSNKACACRKCNKEKNNRTAFDYMKSLGEGEFNAYKERVNDLSEREKISNTKRRKLLMPIEELPDDFIERQLRESQYIAKKAKEMLLSICRNVYSTSGSITDFIRHIWGWDEVLHTLNLPLYREARLTERVERNPDGGRRAEERIVGWSKRLDHRHHAIDALVIACTKQGYIQRINNLNSLKEVAFRPFADDGQDAATRQRLTRLERYMLMQPHFSTAEVARAIERVAVSFKSGKRAATLGKCYVHKGNKRVCVQRGVIVPRGALSEESVYGRIRNSETGTQEYVIKYRIETLKPKDVEYVVDGRIREILQNRLEQAGGKPEKAFAEPVLDHQGRRIRSVRCYTKLTVTVPLRYDPEGNPVAFVKPGNNHHVAFYEDETGQLREHVVTFWHAVERKKYGVPVVVTDPGQVWNDVTERMPQPFLDQLPPSATWRFRFSMQRNEMFILGMDEEAYREAMERDDRATLSRYLYRVQKLAAGAYVFRKHYETRVDDKYPDGNGQTRFSLKKSQQRDAVHWINSIGALQNLAPRKVRVSVTGKITKA